MIESPDNQQGPSVTRAWKPSLTGPLSQADLDRIVGQATEVLWEIGIACGHKPTVERLCSDRGIEYRGGRLRFRPARVYDLIESSRDKSRAAGQEPPTPRELPEERFTLGGCWAGLFYCDPETLRVRKATTAEARYMARFWDARDIAGVVPLVPGDVPPVLVSLASERIALEESRKLGGLLTVLDPEEIRYLIEMNLAAGRRYQMLQQISISPLRFNDEGLEAALQFLGRSDVDVHLAGPIPMAGATCPIEPRAALVQSLAEELGFCVAREVLTGSRGIGIARVEHFDLQYGSIVFGSPEWCLYRAMILQAYEYLTGAPVRWGMFRSVAKQPDEQAACERTASVLWQALLGARHFGAAGQLSVDEVFSPQQVVIDEEILRYVERLVGGLPVVADAGDVLALIREGVAENGFAGLPSTAGTFRHFCWFPSLFRHWNVSRWQTEGAPSVLSVAWDRVKERAAQSKHRLGEEALRAVESIYSKAAARFASATHGLV